MAQLVQNSQSRIGWLVCVRMVIARSVTNIIMILEWSTLCRTIKMSRIVSSRSRIVLLVSTGLTIGQSAIVRSSLRMRQNCKIQFQVDRIDWQRQSRIAILEWNTQTRCMMMRSNVVRIGWHDQCRMISLEQDSQHRLGYSPRVV